MAEMRELLDKMTQMQEQLSQKLTLTQQQNTQLQGQINQMQQKNEEQNTATHTMIKNAVTNTTQTQQNVLARIDQLNTKVDTIEARFNDRVDKRVNEMKSEILDDVQAKILQSEGAQNVATKNTIEGALFSVRNLMTTQLHNESSRINAKVTEVQNRTEIMNVKINVLQEESERSTFKINELDERLTLQEERVLVAQPGASQMPRSLDIKLPIFKDDKKGGAYRFLRELKNYFKIIPIANSLKLNVIPSMMDGTSKDWYYASLDRFQTYHDFEEAFIKRYCNDAVQFNIREQLIKNVYQPKTGYSKAEHFSKQILKNKYLKDPFPQDQLITVVLRNVTLRKRILRCVRKFKMKDDLLWKHCFLTLSIRSTRNFTLFFLGYLL